MLETYINADQIGFGKCGQIHVNATLFIIVLWRRSGSGVECRILDRENPVTNPESRILTHISGVMPRQNEILVGYAFLNETWL